MSGGPQGRISRVSSGRAWCRGREGTELQVCAQHSPGVQVPSTACDTLAAPGTGGRCAELGMGQELQVPEWKPWLPFAA